MMRPGGPHPPYALLRRHVILMGSSYIAAWTAFLLTNPIFSFPPRVNLPLHMFGPTVIGTLLIAWTLRYRYPPPAPNARTS